MKLYDEASKLIPCETKQKEKITSVSQGSMEEGSLVVCIVLHRIFEVACQVKFVAEQVFSTFGYLLCQLLTSDNVMTFSCLNCTTFTP